MIINSIKSYSELTVTGEKENTWLDNVTDRRLFGFQHIYHSRKKIEEKLNYRSYDFLFFFRFDAFNMNSRMRKYAIRNQS